MDDTAYQTALGRLRRAHAVAYQTGQQWSDILISRDEVFAHYQPVFSTAHPDALTAEEFQSFLSFDNNHHWTGLARQGWRACEDMALLRSELRKLLDETRPVVERFDAALGTVPGMGKALTSAILLVAYPDKYGVWNNTSEGAMKSLILWPEFSRGETMGQRYVKVNEVLRRLCADLAVDLWTLDTLWWVLSADVAPDANPPPAVSTRPAEPAPKFWLERHLQDFLFDNWDRTDLGRDWGIYTADGDEEAGYEYPTPIGRIDLLARHRTEPRWLVMELKRDQSGDATIGQLARYIGWVKANLAKPGETVEGLIIAHQADAALRYALSVVPNTRMCLYEVQFKLHPLPETGAT